MTRKDYQLIADAIQPHLEGFRNSSQPDTAVEGIETVAVAIANALKSDNRAFDINRFLKAAGVQE